MPRFLAAVSVPALLLTLAPAAPVPKGKPLFYAQTTVGSKLVYEIADGGEEVVVVTRAEQKEAETIVEVVASRKGTEWYKDKLAVSKAEVASLVEVKGRGEVRLVRLRLPHIPGEKWRCDLGNENGVMIAAFPEWVEVPAGRFWALRVDAESSTNGGRPSRSTDWFAPGVGKVKQVCDGRPYRTLKSFTPGKD